MAMITCKECSANISDTAAACVHCGAPLLRVQTSPPAAVRRASPRIWPWVVAGLVLAFFALGAIQSNTPEGQARSAERRTIETCWTDQGRKSHSPSEQRFIASVCERMEADLAAGRKPFYEAGK